MINLTLLPAAQEDPDLLPTLKLSGPATISNVGQIKSALEGALNDAHGLLIDGSEVTELDLFALQLFCAAHRSVLAAGKTLRFVACFPDTLRPTLATAGFSRQEGTSCPSAASCLWWQHAPTE